MFKLKNSLLTTLVFTTLSFYSFGQKSLGTKTFPNSTPEEQGMSSLVLDSLIQYVITTNQNIHNLTIIRNNHLVLNTDFYPYSSKNLHDLASVTKSITSLLIGIAIDKKYIKNENEPVLKYFPEITHSSKQLDSLKIRDLLAMQSGFKCGLEDGEKALSDMRKTKDWIQFIFNLPMTSEPGTNWSYCSCNYYLLGEILNRTTGLTPLNFAKKYLFNPLNIKGAHWISNYKGINHGWGDLLLHPLDLAKIGQLVLDDGQWGGKQIVSNNWISKSLKSSVKLSEDRGYGYGWWIHNALGGYSEAVGRGEQTLSIIPSENLVVVMFGGGYNQSKIGEFVLKSVKSNLPLKKVNYEYDLLEKTIKNISKGPSTKFSEANRNIIQKLNNKTIEFENNMAGIDAIKLHFSNTKKGVLEIYGKNISGKNPFIISKNSYKIGKDLNVKKLDPKLSLPVAIQAWFNGDDQFILHFNQYCRINNFYFYFTLNGKKVNTKMEETTNFIKTDIKSRIIEK